MNAETPHNGAVTDHTTLLDGYLPGNPYGDPSPSQPHQPFTIIYETRLVEAYSTALSTSASLYPKDRECGAVVVRETLNDLRRYRHPRITAERVQGVTTTKYSIQQVRNSLRKLDDVGFVQRNGHPGFQISIPLQKAFEILASDKDVDVPAPKPDQWDSLPLFHQSEIAVIESVSRLISQNGEIVMADTDLSRIAKDTGLSQRQVMKLIFRLCAGAHPVFSREKIGRYSHIKAGATDFAERIIQAQQVEPIIIQSKTTAPDRRPVEAVGERRVLVPFANQEVTVTVPQRGSITFTPDFTERLAYYCAAVEMMILQHAEPYPSLNDLVTISGGKFTRSEFDLALKKLKSLGIVVGLSQGNRLRMPLAEFKQLINPNGEIHLSTPADPIQSEGLALKEFEIVVLREIGKILLQNGEVVSADIAKLAGELGVAHESLDYIIGNRLSIGPDSPLIHQHKKYHRQRYTLRDSHIDDILDLVANAHTEYIPVVYPNVTTTEPAHVILDKDPEPPPVWSRINVKTYLETAHDSERLLRVLEILNAPFRRQTIVDRKGQAVYVGQLPTITKDLVPILHLIGIREPAILAEVMAIARSNSTTTLDETIRLIEAHDPGNKQATEIRHTLYNLATGQQEKTSVVQRISYDVILDRLRRRLDAATPARQQTSGSVSVFDSSEDSTINPEELYERTRSLLLPRTGRKIGLFRNVDGKLTKYVDINDLLESALQVRAYFNQMWEFFVDFDLARDYVGLDIKQQKAGLSAYYFARIFRVMRAQLELTHEPLPRQFVILAGIMRRICVEQIPLLKKPHDQEELVFFQTMYRQLFNIE